MAMPAWTDGRTFAKQTGMSRERFAKQDALSANADEGFESTEIAKKPAAYILHRRKFRHPLFVFSLLYNSEELKTGR